MQLQILKCTFLHVFKVKNVKRKYNNCQRLSGYTKKLSGYMDLALAGGTLPRLWQDYLHNVTDSPCLVHRMRSWPYCHTATDVIFLFSLGARTGVPSKANLWLASVLISFAPKLYQPWLGVLLPFLFKMRYQTTPSSLFIYVRQSRYLTIILIW